MLNNYIGKQNRMTVPERIWSSPDLLRQIDKHKSLTNITCIKSR
jgi:hypothetical protein